MISMTFDKARSGFFDRAAVLNATDKATRSVLSKFGAFVRRGAKSSIRKRKAVSEPGSPPSSHVGTLKKLIYFSFDAPNKSVVIGPTQSRPGSTAPALLEYGGEATRQGKKGARRLTYRPRPFMGPAFATELPKVPDMWKDSVKPVGG